MVENNTFVGDTSSSKSLRSHFGHLTFYQKNPANKRKMTSALLHRYRKDYKNTFARITTTNLRVIGHELTLRDGKNTSLN